MSVINRMLKDLEKRQEAGDSSVYHPVGEKGSSGKLVAVLSVLVAALLAAVGGLLWYQHQTRAEVRPGVTANGGAGQSAASAASSGGVSDGASGMSAAQGSSAAPATSQTSSQTPTDEAIAAKELEDEKILDGAEKDAQLLALENEIYGPDDLMQLPATGAAEKRRSASGSAKPSHAATNGASSRQGSMKVREVKLTRQQEIELDRKAAGVALSQGNLEEAKSALKSILSRDPANTEARERLAALLYGEHRLEEAKAVLNQGISGQPRYGKYRLLMARILSEEGRKREALTMLAAYSPSATR